MGQLHTGTQDARGNLKADVESGGALEMGIPDWQDSFTINHPSSLFFDADNIRASLDTLDSGNEASLDALPEFELYPPRELEPFTGDPLPWLPFSNNDVMEDASKQCWDLRTQTTLYSGGNLSSRPLTDSRRLQALDGIESTIPEYPPPVLSGVLTKRITRLNQLLDARRQPLPSLVTFIACINDIAEAASGLAAGQKGHAAKRNAVDILEHLIDHLCTIADESIVETGHNQALVRFLLNKLAWREAAVQKTFRAIATSVARPLICSMLSEIGLGKDDEDLCATHQFGHSSNADVLSEVPHHPSILYDHKHVDFDILAECDSALCQSIAQDVKVLRRGCYNHPLLQLRHIDLCEEYLFEEAKDSTKLLKKARSYEKLAMASFEPGHHLSSTSVGSTDADERLWHQSGEDYPWTLPSSARRSDEHQNRDEDFLLTAVDRDIHQSMHGTATSNGDGQIPPPLMQPMRPLLGVQASLAGGSTVRMLLRQERLQRHFFILRQFFTFDSGMFNQKFTTLLFDSKPSTRTMTSESKSPSDADLQHLWTALPFRLALDNILTDASPIQKETRNWLKSKDRDINFVFDTPEVDSIHLHDPFALDAFDHIHLHYKVPSTLKDVISDAILTKYDQMFQQLLRLFHVSHAATILTRQAQLLSPASGRARKSALRFAHRAQHVSSTVLSHATMALSGPWSQLEGDMSFLSAALDDEDAAGVPYGTYVSTSTRDLAALHADTVDSLLRRLCVAPGQERLARALHAVLATLLAGCAVVHAASRAAAGAGAGATLNAAQAETLARLEDDLARAVAELVLALRAGAAGAGAELLARWAGGADGDAEPDVDVAGDVDEAEETTPLSDAECLYLLAQALDV